jgi:hypothetical protein
MTGVKQDHNGSEEPLVLNFGSHNKISTDCYCQTRNQMYQDHGTDVQVDSPKASSCCMRTPIPLCSTKSTTNWMACDGRCSNILDFLPCNFHMSLMKAFKSCPFTSESHVQEAVLQLLRQQPDILFTDGVNISVHHMDCYLMTVDFL